MPTEKFTRRHALTGAATVGLGLPLLAACGDGGTTPSDTPGDAGSSSGGASSPDGGGASGLTTTADVPVGGGTIFADDEVVVTQPTEGEFKGFSVTCTHQGCPVTSISDGLIQCTCHGSAFSIEDGSPQSGPASAPLAEVELVVEGDQISLA